MKNFIRKIIPIYVESVKLRENNVSNIKKFISKKCFISIYLFFRLEARFELIKILIGKWKKKRNKTLEIEAQETGEEIDD